jgi:cell division protein FtsB
MADRSNAPRPNSPRPKAPGEAAGRTPRSKGGSRRAPRSRVVMRFALAGVVLVGLLFAFVYPTRTFLDQRNDTARARAQLGQLRAANAQLAAESKRLQDPDEIEKLARRYGLVKPNEHAFVIVPVPEAVPAPAPEGATASDATTGGSAKPTP